VHEGPFRHKDLDQLIDEGDVPGLIQALGYPKVQRSAGLRDRIVNSLGKLGDSGAVEPISEVLDNDPKPTTRSLAAIALGRIKDAKGIPALRRALDDESRATRMWAIRGLGYLKDRDSVDDLIGCLSSTDVGIREFSAQALGDIGDQRATPFLIRLLEDPKGRVRRAASGGLVKLGDSRGLEPMRRAHEQAGPLARKGIRRSLRELEDRFG
jgi:HEAT repeat protein